MKTITKRGDDMFILEDYIVDYLKKKDYSLAKNLKIDLGSGICGDALLLRNALENEIIDEIFFKEIREKILKLLIDHLAINEVRIGLWEGISGVGFALYYLDIDNELKEFRSKICREIERALEVYYSKLIKLSELGMEDYDLISGLSGILRYIFIENNWSNTFLVENCLKLLLNHTNLFLEYIHNFREESMYEYRSYNISLSHGLSGILAIFSIAASKKHFMSQQFYDSLKEVIYKTSNIIFQSRKMVTEEFWIIPSLLNLLEEDNSFINLSWCYGLVGISSALALSNKVLERDDICQDIYNNYTHALEYKEKQLNDEDLFFCHGYSGLVYFYAITINFNKNIVK